MKRSRILLSIFFLSAVFLISCTASKKNESKDLIRKGKLYSQYGKVDSALMFFNQAEKLDKSNYEPHIFKRSIYLGKEDYKNAIAESQMIIKKNPHDGQEWLFTAIIYDILGDSSSAEKHYKRCIEISNSKLDTLSNNTNDVKFRGNIALAYLLMGDPRGESELISISKDYPNQTYSKLLNADKKEILKYFR